MNRSYVLPVVGILLVCRAIVAETLISHHGSTDPMAEGWSRSIAGPDDNLFVGPVTIGGTDAWYVHDDSTTSKTEYYYTLSDADREDSMALGWSLRVNLRVPSVDPNTSAVKFGIGFGDHRYHVTFDMQADDDPMVYIGGQQVYVIDGAGKTFNEYEVRYDSDADEADLFVNGVLRFSDVTSSSGSAQAVYFGSGNGGGRGRSEFASVVFEIFHDTPSVPAPAIPMAGSLALLTLRRSHHVLSNTGGARIR